MIGPLGSRGTRGHRHRAEEHRNSFGQFEGTRIVDLANCVCKVCVGNTAVRAVAANYISNVKFTAQGCMQIGKQLIFHLSVANVRNG